jgi:hypothetical protein
MKSIKYFLAILVFGLSLSSMLIAQPVGAAWSSSDETDPTLKGLTETAENVPLYKSDVQENATVRTMLLDRVGGLVGLILSFVGVIFLVLTVYAGIMWMTAQGNSAKVEKAKDLLINAVIGLVIVSAAYSLTIFVGNQLVK